MPRPDPGTLGLHHLALFARDVEAVTRFYRDVVGLPELTRHHEHDGALRSVWLALDAQGRFLAVERARGEAHGQLGVQVVALTIEAASRAGWEAHLAEHGFPAHRHTGWTFYVRDPEGNTVGFSHHPHAAVDRPEADRR